MLLAVEFVVEIAGGTPTVTYKIQGSVDPMTTADGSANWFDVFQIPNDSDTAALTKVVTAVGAYLTSPTQQHTRFFQRVRLVTTANTNITYRANLRGAFRT